MKVSVIIPTFRRPQWLRRCVASLAAQKRLPDEVIVVVRDTGDDESVGEARHLGEHHRSSFPIRTAFVREPGFLPPLAAGRAVATGDIVCFIDDDAEAFPDWISRLLEHYRRDEVGGVGGSTPRFDDRGRVDFGTASEVGRLKWYGRLVGDYHKDVLPAGAREVHFLMGGNVSYRREILNRLDIDPRLNREAAYLYEVDLGLQVRRSGYRLVFEPEAKIRHYSAPRPSGVANREISLPALRAAGHNYAYILLKHLGSIRRAALLVYLLFIGSSHCPGAAWLAWATLRGDFGGWTRAAASWRGVLDGLASHRRWKAKYGLT